MQSFADSLKLAKSLGCELINEKASRPDLRAK